MRWFVCSSLVLAAVVVVLGAFTRLVDAGLGCPDWPGCYGHLLWPTDAEEIAAAQAKFPEAPVDLTKTWPEMVHRYFATALGLVILVFTALAWRARSGSKSPGIASSGMPVGLTTGLLGMVILQGAFGAWTVTLKLWPQVVTAHLLGGFMTLSLLWLLALRTGALGPVSRFTVPARLRSHAMLALVVLVVQIALGGWVSSNYAALACPDFPTCHGELWPQSMDLGAGFNIGQSVGPNYLGGLLESEARVAIQMFHRLGALLVLLLVGSLAYRLWRVSHWLAWPVALVLGLQLGLGIANVLLVLPLWIATAHNAFGAVTLLLVVTVNYGAFQHRLGTSTPLPAGSPT
ncbi:MAG: COX15/CtaA family protein [Pseudomonadales bacterium]